MQYLSKSLNRATAALFAVVAFFSLAQGAFAQGPTYPDMEDEVTTGLTALAAVVGLIVTAAITYKVIKLALRWFTKSGG